MQNYQHSGAIPPLGLLWTMGVSFVSAAIMGVGYCMLFYYIPIIYLNFLLTIGFGAILGAIVGGSAYSSKIRNTFAVALIGFLAATIGLYFSWGTTVFGVVPMAELPATIADVNIGAYLPLNIKLTAEALFEKGSWGLRRGGNITGWFLVFFWVLEAGVVYYYTVSSAAEAVAKDVFCEQCYTWIPTEIVQLLKADGTESAWEDIRLGMLEPLSEFERSSGTDSFVKVSVNCCPSCSMSQFFSIDACTTKVDNDGDKTIKERSIIRHQHFNAADIDLIRNCGQPATDEVQTPDIGPPPEIDPEE